MSFLYPGLLLWALPILGAIVALYLLKMRRRELKVPASFLWPKHVEEIRANSLFQRLRFSWLLVLQLLAAALACLAIARPQVLTRGLSGRSTVIVIDSSLTMGSTDVKPSRLEVAKQKAREIVNAAPVGERISIINAGVQPEVMSPLMHDPAGQLRAIASIDRTDAPPTVGEAMRIAAALVGSNESGRIVLLSDGQFGQIANFAPGKASVAFESVGSQDDNLSISAFGITDSPQGRQLFCAVKNTGSTSQKAVFNVYGDAASLDSESISLPAQGEWSKTLPVVSAPAIYRGELQANDDLAADNSVVITAKKGGSMRVLLVTPEDPFTEKALALDPRVNLDKSNGVPQSELIAGGSRYDLIVFDGVPEQKVSTPSVLVLGAAGEITKHPSFQNQSKTALLDAVDLSQVSVDESAHIDASGKVDATSSAGPELTEDDGPQRKIVLAFNPLKSDFPLQPSYPIFIANALTFLSASGDKGPLVVAPGRAFAVRASSSAELVSPEKQTIAAKPKGGVAEFTGLPQVGKYKLTVDGKSRDVYCSLEPKANSVLPIPQLAAGSSKLKSSAAALSAVDYWPYVLLGLFGLLIFEWFFYARRS